MYSRATVLHIVMILRMKRAVMKHQACKFRINSSNYINFELNSFFLLKKL